MLSRAALRLARPLTGAAARRALGPAAAQTAWPLQQRRHNSGGGSEAVVEAATTAATTAAETLGWSPSHLVMYSIDSIHTLAGLPYWEAIIAFTLAFRVAILPLGIWTVQGSARMAAVRPHIQKLSDQLKTNPNADSHTRQQFALESRALMKHYKVNPLTALAMPLVQFPIFMSCFFGLQSMAEFFPGFATGGAFWFTNLAAPDALLILPVANALSFLVMIEMGADGLQTSDQDTFKWVMRGLAVALTPLTMNMPQGLFIYWSANNAFSIAQAGALKHPALRKRLDIPPPPAAGSQPALKMRNPLKFLKDAWDKERLVGDRAKAEIVDGTRLAGPGSAAAAASAAGAAAVPPKPVVTFSQKPKPKKKQ